MIDRMTTSTEQKVVRSRLDIAREKATKAVALLQQLEAQAQAKSAKDQRLLDTRRKVLLGSYLLSKIERDPDYKKSVLADLDRYLVRPVERALFDLLPIVEPTPAPVSEPAPSISRAARFATGSHNQLTTPTVAAPFAHEPVSGPDAQAQG
jgi:hypothetical protein